jgi:phosphate transport system substrate-binding protein
MTEEKSLFGTTYRRRALAVGILAAVLLAACSNTPAAQSSSPSASSSAGASASTSGHPLDQVPPAPNFNGNIAGAGATFPNPIYQQWLVDYNKDNPNIKVSYDSIGSGGGVAQITANTLQFGGSDAPMKPAEREAAKAKNGSEVLHIPTVFGAVVPAYNLSSVSAKLQFTPEALGGIFAGKITKWNDQAIASANPGVTLPASDITVVHRSDGSGTTNVFTDYLTKVSPVWKDTLGANSVGKEVAWPVGLGGQGNEGVTATVTQTPGAIGYIELAYAIQNNVPFGKVKNKAGNFVDASLASVTAAANLATIPDDLTFSSTNTDAADGYPITNATWLLVYKEQDKVSDNQSRSEALVHFLLWVLDKGEGEAKDLNYASLPDNLLTAARQAVATISWNGQPIVDALYK